MPRHMLQPGSRQSKPAVLKTWSRPSASAWRFDGLRAGDDHGADGGGDVMAADDCGGGAEVFDAAVGAGAEEDGVDLDVFDGRAGLEAHVFEGALEVLAVGFGEASVGQWGRCCRWW